MKPSELEFSISVESYDEKTAENYRNCYVAEKRIVIINNLIRVSIKTCAEIITKRCQSLMKFVQN